MAVILRMPEVAANAAEAVLAGWPMREGTRFSAGDVIATIETEKAVVDVLAEKDGIMLRSLVPVGAQVLVGAPIAILGEAEEHVEDIDSLLAELGVSTTAELEIPPRSSPPSDQSPIRAGLGHATEPAGAHTRVFSSPLARRLAKEQALSLDQIVGTGRGGRIVRRDVELAATGRTRAHTEHRSAAPGGSRLRPAREGFTDLPHSRMRRAIAERLTASVRDAPQFHVEGTARVDRLLKLRGRINPASPTHVSVNDFIVLAAARAHIAVPGMNVIWTEDAVRAFDDVDIAVAVATERGLLTPVLRQVDQMGLLDISRETADLAARARSGTLRQDELEGGALSVTNLGMFGTERFTAIINPPQSAILAVGAAREEPHVGRGKLTVATHIHVTLSVDHRPIDGALAAQWMKTFLELVEHPVRLLIGV